MLLTLDPKPMKESLMDSFGTVLKKYNTDRISEIKTPIRHVNITFEQLVAAMEDNADSEIYSNELKKQAGFGKDGEKGFDGAITNLMMQTYLCNCDFKKRVNKKGIEYGWDVAVYSSIEHIYGYDYVTSCYKDNPQDSWKQLVDYMHEMYPEATDKQIRKILK